MHDLPEDLIRITKLMKPQRAIEKLRNHVRDNVMAQLEARGVLTVQKTKILGLFPTKTYTLHDPQAVSDLRRLVGDVAQGYNGPDERTSALITLAAGNWAGVAVKKALEAVHAAVMAGAMAGTIAASTGSN